MRMDRKSGNGNSTVRTEPMPAALDTSDLAPGELELVLLRTELRALVKRWRNNLANDGAGTRSRRELVALMTAQIESILEGGR